MSQYKLHVIIFKIFLLNFSDHPFEVYDHYHLIFVTRSPTKIHSPTLKLVNTVSLRLHILRVVNELLEPFSTIFIGHLLPSESILCLILL